MTAHRLLLLCLVLALPGLAQAQTSPAALAVAALPAQAQGFQRSGTPMDYDSQPGRAGLGAAQRYVPADGSRAFATVFLYDLGQRRGPDGAGSPDAMQQLRAAAAEIEAQVRNGRLRSLAPAGGLVVTAPGGTPRILCESGRAVQQDGSVTAEGLCVTIHRGRFAKLRLTSWVAGDPAQAGLLAAGLLTALLEAPVVTGVGARKGS